MAKTVSGVTTYVVYGLNGERLGEFDSNGLAIAEYAYLNGQPIAAFTSAGTYHLHTDHLGTPRVATDANGATAWFWSMENNAFGDKPAVTVTDNDLPGLDLAHRFPGKFYHPETGLHYNYFRDYEPGTGRYVESDLIGLGGGISTYAYVSANPLYWTDPSGLVALVFDVAKGTLTVDPEREDESSYEIDVTSGKEECLNEPKCEKTPNKGPIPRGNYYIDSTQIDNPSLSGDFERNFLTPSSDGGGDWGDWRVRIYPRPKTERFGRTGFYLHGGFFDGSAGCIDFGGGLLGNDLLLNDLLSDPDNIIPLIVE